jgi:hypothetical protein
MATRRLQASEDTLAKMPLMHMWWVCGAKGGECDSWVLYMIASGLLREGDEVHSSTHVPLQRTDPSLKLFLGLSQLPWGVQVYFSRG